MNDQQQESFMRMAIALSVENVENGGGPFGAVIVKDGEVLARGKNRVTANNDPTAHAEIIAIRNAAAKLGTFDLSGCEIYTSCEPCPMCLGAIYWAHFDKIFYGNTKTDAAKIGFDDSFIYTELEKSVNKRTIKTAQLLAQEAIEGFKAWEEKVDKISY
ncbi:MAG: nucleoside deaminase [Paludibacter sp.]|nr:nucleoside deaminase [Paludibacter sp.]